MSNSFVKAEKVVDVGLRLLSREITLPGLVWRDAGGSFAGAKDDTINMRLPAYAVAKSRTMRSQTQIDMSELVEMTVPVQLTKHIYFAVPITDEQMTLDIEDFARQVSAPSVSAVARGVEDVVATLINTAVYPSEHQITVNRSKEDGESGELGLLRATTRARRLLNDANVPQDGRTFLVGSEYEEYILSLDELTRVDASGDSSALRDATIGRLRGFRVVVSNSIAPDAAFAFHRSAYALSMQAPVVPQGASWGTGLAANGFSMRQLKDYDFANTRDRLLTDVFVGANVVSDKGDFDENGKFVPWDGDGHDPGSKLVRAVKLTLAEEGS